MLPSDHEGTPKNGLWFVRARTRCAFRNRDGVSATALVESPAEVQALTNGSEGNGRRLSNRAKGLILSLSDAGKTQTEIAQVIGCTVSTVSRTLDDLVDNRVLARRQLEAAATKLVHTITQSKDAATALRTLQKLDVVRDEQDRGGVNIAIAIGQPGQGLAAPVIELSPVCPQLVGETAQKA